MLKKILFAAALLWLWAFNAHAAQEAPYEAGKHYIIVSDQKTEQNEIREFYSYWCGHCFSLQEQFEYLQKRFESKAKFVLNPIDLMGGPMGPETQKGYAVALLMGLDKTYSKDLFDLIHVQGKAPRSHKDMVDFFASIGVPEEKFEQDYGSFAISGIISGYNSWVKKTKIDAVPELVVNGKYKLVMEAFDNMDDLAKLIEYLLTLD